MFYAINWFLSLALLALWSLACWALHAVTVWVVSSAGALAGGSAVADVILMPAWLKAKVARFEAKAFSNTADDGSILNEKDVIARSSGEGIQRTCIQDIGSTTTDTRTTTGGPGGKQQIVVLRGNLVNICR